MPQRQGATVRRESDAVDAVPPDVQQRQGLTAACLPHSYRIVSTAGHQELVVRRESQRRVDVSSCDRESLSQGGHLLDVERLVDVRGTIADGAKTRAASPAPHLGGRALILDLKSNITHRTADTHDRRFLHVYEQAALSHGC